METCDIKCKTWHEVLIEKGFDQYTSKALIGFISWNKGEDFYKLGKEITEMLTGYEGRIIARDVVSTKFNDKGLLFFNTDIPENTANEMFDAIMSYEQKDVYHSLP